MEYRPIEKEDLSGVLKICESEGWSSYTADPQTAWRSFTAPGVITVVAVEDGRVAGFAQMQSDGVIQAHLSLIAVAKSCRRGGIGRRLVEEAFVACGAKRVDLVSDTAERFYESFRHRPLPGFRIYPEKQSGTRLGGPKGGHDDVS